MSKNKFDIDKRITLDAKHLEMIKHFNKIELDIPKKKNELEGLFIEYKKLESIPKNKTTSDICDKKHELKKQIIELNRYIKDIKNKQNQNNYYLDVGQLLHSYYENINTIAKDSKQKDDTINRKISKKTSSESTDEDDDEKSYKNVLDFFNTRNNNSNNSDNNNAESNYASTKISDFMKTESNFKRTDLLEDYLKCVDENYIAKIKIDNSSDKCPNKNCNNNEMIVIPSEGIQICEKCGLQLSVLIESDKPSFKDPPPEISYFAYKRINHFNESDRVYAKYILHWIYQCIKYTYLNKKLNE